jgi:PAS domain S-box-containing protein
MSHSAADPVTLWRIFDTNMPFHGIGLLLIIITVLALWNRASLIRNGRAYEKMSRRYANTVNVALDAIVVTDASGVILDFNPAAERLFGYSRNAAMGAAMAGLIVPEHHREAHTKGMARLLATGEPHVVNRGRVRMEGLRADGKLVPIELSIGMTEDPEGPIFTGYIRDISDQIKAQSDITEARDEALAAMNAKSQFLAVMSHEMRTPLNGVLAVLDILASGKLDGRQRKFLDAAINSGELLQRHIDDLLQLNELENRRMTFHRTTVNIREMVQDVIAMNTAAAAAHGNKIFFDTEIGDVYIVEDRHRISQVLVNLVSNAVKFTRDGRIQIDAARVEGPDGEALLELSVHDEGAGIPEEDQERIFDTFVTLDPTYRQATRGYGLGLAICRRIVRAMGGDIGVESRLGVYSRFWVRLPFREASAHGSARAFQGSTARPFELPAGAMDLRVLLVEDDETNRLVAREMLARFGCDITEAVDGCDALAKAETVKFDLILMDVNMPNLGGMEATRRLRKSAESASQFTPIVGVTAHALPEEQERLREAGMQECLIKPVRARNLQALLRRFADFPGEFSGDDGSEAADAAPFIDESVFDELASLLPPKMFNERLSAFVSEIGGVETTLGAAWAAGDVETLGKTAHKFAGASAVFGAARLREQLVKIEMAARDNKAADLPELVAGAARVSTRTIKAFDARKAA